MTDLSIGKLHKLADVTRREIEGYKALGKVYEWSEAEIYLRRIQAEIERRNQKSTDGAKVCKIDEH